MDERRFDALTTLLAAGGSRRTFARLLAGGLLGGLASVAVHAGDETSAKTKRPPHPAKPARSDGPGHDHPATGGTASAPARHPAADARGHGPAPAAPRKRHKPRKRCKAACAEQGGHCCADRSCAPAGQCCPNEDQCGDGACVTTDQCCPGQHKCPGGPCVTNDHCCPGERQCPDGTCEQNHCCVGENECDDGSCLPGGQCCPEERTCADGTCLPLDLCCPGQRKCGGNCIPADLCCEDDPFPICNCGAVVCDHGTWKCQYSGDQCWGSCCPEGMSCGPFDGVCCNDAGHCACASGYQGGVGCNGKCCRYGCNGSGCNPAPA